MEKNLFLAFELGKLEDVKRLLQNNVNVNWQDSDSRTPFYVACQEGRIEIVKLLLNDQRVDINKNIFGATPLFVACKEGHLDIVTLLLNDTRIEVNEPDNDGDDPLKHQFSNGSVSFAGKATEGMAPFHIACQNGQVEIVVLLLEHPKSIFLLFLNQI